MLNGTQEGTVMIGLYLGLGGLSAILVTAAILFNHLGWQAQHGE